MPSYIPEHVYGPVPDANGRWTGQYGLMPWPAHLMPRDPLPDIDLPELFGEEPKPPMPALAEADGVFFITLAKGDRQSIATTVERLINMLDDMEEDPDLEPYLAGLHQGSRTDDFEADYCSPTGGTADDELSLGWNNEGRQSLLLDSQRDLEPDLGTTEEIDQTWRKEGYDSIPFLGGDAEPSLGWSDRDDQSLIGLAPSGDAGLEECEQENEHGGDIQDEPHDALDEGNDEPFLGWSEAQSTNGAIATGAEFDRRTNGPSTFNGDGGVAGRKVLQNLRAKRPDVPQEYVRGWPGVGSYDALKVDGLTITGTMPREKASRDASGTIVREFDPFAGDVPLLKASDFDRLPWADFDAPEGEARQ